MASAAIALGGLVLAESSQRKARKQQKKASRLQGKQAELQNARSRRQQVAQARRLRAQTVAQGEAAGVSGGSQVAGAVGSLQTQAASNVSFLNQLEGFDQARSSALESAGRNAARAQTFQATAQALNSGAGQEAVNSAISFFKN